MFYTVGGRYTLTIKRQVSKRLNPTTDGDGRLRRSYEDCDVTLWGREKSRTFGKRSKNLPCFHSHSF